MGNYISHLKSEYGNNTSERKIDYFKYNFGGILKKLTKSSSILEVGPGMGEIVSYLNRKGITNIDILDNDRGVIDHIKKNFKIRNVVNKQLANYDLVAMIQVLEHIPIDKQAGMIKNLFIHLNKNGSIMIVVPNANNPLGMVERYGDLQHTNAFTTQSLFDLIETSEIKNYEVEIKGFEIPPYSLVNVLRILFQKMLHTFLLLVMVINGGTFFKIMTPNIVLIIQKKV